MYKKLATIAIVISQLSTATLLSKNHADIKKPYKMNISLYIEDMLLEPKRTSLRAHISFNDTENQLTGWVLIKVRSEDSKVYKNFYTAIGQQDEATLVQKEVFRDIPLPCTITEMYDIEDAKGPLARIVGDTFAGYDVHDNKGDLVAKTAFDKNTKEVTIKSGNEVIAILKRNNAGNQIPMNYKDYWTMEVLQPTKLDYRIIQLLGTLIIHNEIL